MKVDDAIGEVRAAVERARRAAVGEVTVPVEVADAVATLGAECRAGDLINALVAVDLVDCSPRMLQRRALLLSRLRLDAADGQARAQASDLLLAAKLRRALHCAMVEALDEGDRERAQMLRDRLLDAESETLGWQRDAMRALGEGGGERDGA